MTIIPGSIIIVSQEVPVYVIQRCEWKLLKNEISTSFWQKVSHERTGSIFYCSRKQGINYYKRIYDVKLIDSDGILGNAVYKQEQLR